MREDVSHVEAVGLPMVGAWARSGGFLGALVGCFGFGLGFGLLYAIEKATGLGGLVGLVRCSIRLIDASCVGLHVPESLPL